MALKFLTPHLLDSPELKEWFPIEAQSAAALSHPNICVIHKVGEEEELSLIAMEYVEGETLRDRIMKGPLNTVSVEFDIVGYVLIFLTSIGDDLDTNGDGDPRGPSN